MRALVVPLTEFRVPIVTAIVAWSPWSSTHSDALVVPRLDWRIRLVLMARALSSEDATVVLEDPSTVDTDVTSSVASSPGPSLPDHDDEAAHEVPTSPPPIEHMAELVAEHSDAVYRVALSVTRDPVLAEDVAQDALIKAWQAMPSYRGEAPLKNWILRITHNTAVSALRKRREEIRDPADLPEQAHGVSTEAQVQQRLAMDRFELALDELDEVSRSIVVLREVEGLSYDEICAVLKLPLPTVKTRLLRARRQLAIALEGWQP